MIEKANNKLKTAIIILSILLALTLALLVGVVVYDHIVKSDGATVSVPDNIITPEDAENEELSLQSNISLLSATVGTASVESKTTDEDGTSSQGAAAQSDTEDSAADETGSVLWLHKRQPDDSTPFSVGNMFPGDSETKYYSVKVSHKGDVTLRFHADIRQGSEKLSEVLSCRISLPDSGEVLYEGLMRDMPESVNTPLNTSTSTVSEVRYKIDVYLDTSVGNDYMDKELIADFRWWVEETDNLEIPQTGDTLGLCIFIILASGSLLLLILLYRKKKREEAVSEND